MNTQEAKLVLRAWRPGDEDEGGTVFREALERARGEPELAAWLEREQAFDRAVGDALSLVSAPEGLRESILIGGRASRSRSPWWRRPTALALAAAFVVAVGISLLWLPRERAFEGGGDGLEPMELMRFAVFNLAHGPHGYSDAPGSARLEEALAQHRGGLVEATGLGLSVEAAAKAGCQRFVVGGREVFEICFQRDGAWFHLYLVRADPGRSVPGGGGVAWLESEGIVVAAWERAGTVYTLATEAGMEVLRRVL